MGLEEDLKKISDLFVEQYVIKGEETEDLKEVLRGAPDSLIDVIWENIAEENPDEELSRQQKEESLYRDIPEYFEAEFELLDIAKIRLLMRIMNYYPIDILEGADATRDFVPYGWVFCFNDDDGSSFVVMKEVQDIIRTLEKPDVKESILFMNAVRFAV